jgi:preprotein translocase subunit YajC
MTDAFAQASPPASSPGILQGPLGIIIWLGGMFLIMYVLYIRPQQKRQREHQRLLSALKRGDRVLTSGGMYGTVIGVKDDVVVLKIADDTKAEFRRSAVVEIEKSGE